MGRGDSNDGSSVSLLRMPSVHFLSDSAAHGEEITLILVLEFVDMLGKAGLPVNLTTSLLLLLSLRLSFSGSVLPLALDHSVSLSLLSLP